MRYTKHSREELIKVTIFIKFKGIKSSREGFFWAGEEEGLKGEIEDVVKASNLTFDCIKLDLIA